MERLHNVKDLAPFVSGQQEKEKKKKRSSFTVIKWQHVRFFVSTSETEKGEIEEGGLSVTG